MTGESFIDVDFRQCPKHGQRVSGDRFLTRRFKDEGRIISVLSDGLGSGVKASVLSNLTATMALRYTAAFMDVRQSARTIMDTLPICEERRISYSTFTIVDLREDGHARVIEHGNPPLLLLRDAQPLPLERIEFALEKWKDRAMYYTEFQVQRGDRIVFYSDGVNQSGMGRKGFPLGWGNENVRRFVSRHISEHSEIPAGELASVLTQIALTNDNHVAKDDITCGIIHYRCPRSLLVVTGPPFNADCDPDLANRIRDFSGRKAICGGTTATIVSRLLGRPVTLSLNSFNPEVPPAARMEGVDLVTEGTLTLARAAELLEHGDDSESSRPNPARDLVRLMLDNDVVQFLVGTRINEAHQDPSVPVELDLRRNVVRRIASVLESRYRKNVQLQFI
ncbi:MAG TPA: SpoIIE family protein phosphatase [Candidatus Paceibacterota bacterium]|nr:SpoIIE family protein phosphatase [Verrucomicrobiota bacterium]HRY49322.1 SpoIIE family protein phosphatase [Candidatus Paceibacterota bacterium]HRZ99399.1 SpoIIE family protein phosphatase [Candidatus Paceibacterota bacterium]